MFFLKTTQHTAIPAESLKRGWNQICQEPIRSNKKTEIHRSLAGSYHLSTLLTSPLERMVLRLRVPLCVSARTVSKCTKAINHTYVQLICGCVDQSATLPTVQTVHADVCATCASLRIYPRAHSSMDYCSVNTMELSASKWIHTCWYPALANGAARMRACPSVCVRLNQSKYMCKLARVCVYT